MRYFSKDIRNNPTFNTSGLSVSGYFLEKANRIYNVQAYNKNQLVKQTSLTNVSLYFFVFAPSCFQTKGNKSASSEYSDGLKKNFLELVK